jgi:cytosine/adenosine deaminase-related metal-dependent hydrolase
MDAPPIGDGWVEVEAGRVVAVGGPEASPRGVRLANFPDDVAMLPGLVNAHTHLELSWMAGLVPPSESMGRWIRALMARRRNAPPAEDVQRQAAAVAVSHARACGTSAFGDIGNTLMAAAVLADAGIPAVLFHEVIGFGPGDARARASEAASRVMRAVTPPVTPGLASHAPYSVSPDLFRAVADEAAAHRLPSSVHLAESPEEVDFLLSGSGEIADMLKHLGAWNDEWSPPGVDPAEYLDRLGVLRPGLLAVHATQLAAEALGRLADRGCVIVSCPRSNRWVGAGDPPIAAFYASGARVAFGTDSLASVADLNLFSEIAAARRLAPEVSARRLLASATVDGAAALGLAGELGTISPGKRADLIAVRIPPGVVDVEEYLVGGIPASDVEWVGRE